MALQFLHKAIEEIVLDIICRNGEVNLANLGGQLKDMLGHPPKSLLDRTVCFEGEESSKQNLKRTLSPFIDNVPSLRVYGAGIATLRSFHGCKNPALQAWENGEKEGVVRYRMAVLTEACRILLNGSLPESLNPNEKGHGENTLLHLVAGLPSNSAFYDLKNEQYLKLLLQNGADPRVKNVDELTPLHIVAGRLKFDIHCGFNVPDEARMSPAMWPCDSRCKQLKLLSSEELFSRAEFVSCMKSRGRHGNNILHEWVLATTEDIQDELQLGTYILSLDVIPGVCNDVGCTPLHYAYDAEVFKTLISKGTVRERHNDSGDTPLLSLIKNGIINGSNREKLLQLPTGPNEDKSQIEEIITMVSTQNHNLLARDGERNHAINILLESVKQSRFQPTHLPSVCRMLVSIVKCSSTKALNEENEAPTTLLEAVFDCIESVYQHPPAALDPVHPLVEVMRTLLEKGMNPNVLQGPNKETLIHKCCRSESLPPETASELISTLLFHEADHSLKNKQQETPEKVLLRRKHFHKSLREALVNTQPKTAIRVNFKTKVHKERLRKLCVSSPRKIDCYRYDPTVSIGEGVMGVVLPAIDEKGKREVALKRIQKDYKEKGVAREIEALCKLTKYKQVVDYYTIVDTEPDFHFIVLELMEGDLADLIQQQKQALAKKSIMAKLVGDMVKGLKYLHGQPRGGILHRDLKPGNVLYTDVPDLCLKIADFSLAKDLTGYSTRTTTGGQSLAGTRGWMAPELVSRTQSSHTKESDVFSLGLVCHFLMSKGKHPFDPRRTVLIKQAANAQSVLPAHELEQAIVDGTSSMDERELTPEGHHLLPQLLTKEPEGRLKVAVIGRHCFFWSIHKKIQFLMAVGDQEEIAQPHLHGTSGFILSLQNTQLGRRLSCNPWHVEIPALYQKMQVYKTYTTTSLADLVRFFRNAYTHEEEQSSACKAELMSNVFFQKFPRLLLTISVAVQREGWDKPRTDAQRQRIRRALSIE